MAQTKQRPRLSRMQFSLRAVLIILTCVAIAGWWWQERFQVETSVPAKRLTESGAVVSVDHTKTESMRRQGFKDVLRDGPTTVINEAGQLISEEEWRQGKRHGVYRRWDEEGELLFECEFKRGKLVRVGQRQVADFLLAIETANADHAIRFAQALDGEVHFDYLDQPLNAVIDDVSFHHNIPMMIDTRAFDAAGIHTDTPVRANLRRVPLFVALIELLAPMKLVCTYRHEVLWVTTADSELMSDDFVHQVVTDHASPELLETLSKEASFDYLDQLLHEVLDDVSFNHDVTIDRELIDPEEPVTAHIKGVSLQSALGILLYRHQLTCESQAGKLVITDEEGKVRMPRPAAKEKPATAAQPGAVPTDPFGSSPKDPSSKEALNEDPFSGG